MTKPDGFVSNKEGKETQRISEADSQANAAVIAREEALEQVC